jgi:hypothetical protein
MQIGIDSFAAAISDPAAGLTLSPVDRMHHAGAVCPLAAALLAGGKVFAFMKRSLHAEEWVRRALGVVVLCGVLAVVFGWDTGILRRLSLSGTSRLEQNLLARFHPVAYAGANVAEQVSLGKEGSLPSLDGAVAWLNYKPLSRSDLKGKVVLIDRHRCDGGPTRNDLGPDALH